MDGLKTIAWIFLATAMASEQRPSKLSGISMIADGINHAVPTESELRDSLRWLVSKDIVLKEGKRYSLTGNGKEIYSRGKGNSGKLLQMWEDLETEIRKLL